MLRFFTAREHGIDNPNFIKRAESTRRAYELELSKHYECQRVFDSAVNSLDIESIEQRYLLSGGTSGVVVIYDLHNTSGKPEFKYPMVATAGKSNRCSHKFSVDTVKWYPPDNGMFLSSGMDKLLKVWDSNTLKTADEYQFNGVVYSHDMSQVATQHCLVAVATASSAAKLIDLKSGSSTHSLRGHKKNLRDVKWSTKDEYIVATGGEDSRVMLWDVRSAKGSLMVLDQHNGDPSAGPNSVNTAHDGLINALKFTPDGLTLLSFGTDRTLKVWNATNGRNLLVNFGRLENESKKCVEFAVTQDTSPPLVFLPVDSEIEIFDILSGAKVKTLRGHYNQVNCCITNPTTGDIISCGNDRNILIWEPRTESVIEYEESLKTVEKKVTSGFVRRIDATVDAWSSDED